MTCMPENRRRPRQNQLISRRRVREVAKAFALKTDDPDHLSGVVVSFLARLLDYRACPPPGPLRNSLPSPFPPYWSALRTAWAGSSRAFLLTSSKSGASVD